MPKYILKLEIGGKKFQSAITEAKTHNQALFLIRKRYKKTLKGWTNFDLLDNIGVVGKDLTGICKKQKRT